MTTTLCPRCEKNRFTPYPEAGDERPSRDQTSEFPYPALSRVADIYICSSCGTDEAMRDFMQESPVPPDEWPIKEGESDE